MFLFLVLTAGICKEAREYVENEVKKQLSEEKQ